MRCVKIEARVGFFRRTRDRVTGCFRQELKYAGAMQYRLFSAVLRQTVIVFRLVWYVIKRICCDRAFLRRLYPRTQEKTRRPLCDEEMQT
jgi:hypothetical protein